MAALETARKRVNVNSVTTLIIYILSVYFVVILLWYANTLMMNQTRFINLILGPGLAIFYLNQFLEKREIFLSSDTLELPGNLLANIPRYNLLRRLTVYSYPILAVLSIGFTLYVEYHFDRLRVNAPLVGMISTDIYVGLLIIVLFLHATKVAFGWIIALFTVFTILYAFFGSWMPGIFQHGGLNTESIVWESAISLSGVYGFIPRVGMTWVAIFIVFAGMAKSFGLLDYVMNIGQEVGSKTRTGITHVAVVSSMIIGSMTGAAAANTATTGSFTIPLMKDQGIKDTYASAIESVASSGSQILPPIMGVAAFLMAEIIGMSYFEVIRGAALPAILFFLSVTFIVHFLILKHDWTVEVDNDPMDYSVFMGGAHFIIPLGVLLYTLVVERMTPLGAGLYTIIALLAVHTIWELYDGGLNLENVQELIFSYFKGAKEGTLEMAPLIGVLGALGIIVQMIQQTGLSGKISTQIIGIAGGLFIPLLLLAMVTSLLFGLGMPTPAAYILVVFLVAPALLEFGVQDLTAHMFVFYFAMLSAITPPVALCCAIASRIGDCSFMATCKEALRIGAPAFLLPFVFVFNDSLLFWSIPTTPLVFLMIVFGFMLLGMTLAGHNSVRQLSWSLRGLYLLIALGIFFAPFQLMIAVTAAGMVMLLVDIIGITKIRAALGPQ